MMPQYLHRTRDLAPPVIDDTTIVSASGLHKTYDTGSVHVNALSGVDLALRRGEMVQASFLVESLLVTLVGVVVGSRLGLWVAFNVVLGVVLACSVLTTWLPSVRASRTYPATALRYE